VEDEICVNNNLTFKLERFTF